MKKSSIFISVLVASMMMSSLYAAWAVEEYNQNYCTHKISDGNWEIGVYKYSDDKWSLGRPVGHNGSSYIAGSGVLDLRTVEADCGVVLKVSNNGALESISGLTEVYLPDSLESTTGNTFHNCVNLTKAILGSGMKKLGERAFYRCSSLSEVYLPEGLEEIQALAFDGLSKLVLTPEDFPSTLTTIGNCAFRNCSSITGDLVLPNFTNPNGGYQFEGTGLTSLTVPALENVAEGILFNAKNLKTFTCSPNVTNIGYRAFQNTPIVTFNPGEMRKLKTIGQEAFRGCTSLTTSFDLSKSQLETVPTYAFVDLQKVKSIKFPKTLKHLGSECLGYNKTSRDVWFMGPPPTVDNSALKSNGGSWLLIAGCEFADQWEESENVIPLEEGDAAKALKLAAELGVTGVKPMGKWTYQAGGYTHWVMEELPKATLISIY